MGSASYAPLFIVTGQRVLATNQTLARSLPEPITAVSRSTGTISLRLLKRYRAGDHLKRYKDGIHIAINGLQPVCATVTLN